jgi:hypothetical protein
MERALLLLSSGSAVSTSSRPCGGQVQTRGAAVSRVRTPLQKAALAQRIDHAHHIRWQHGQLLTELTRVMPGLLPPATARKTRQS